MGPALFVGDPRFLKEIMQEHQRYMLEGIDLNPYLNKKLDKPLPRFLSYEVDSMAAPHIFQVQSQNVQMINHSHGHMMRRDSFITNFLYSVRMRNIQGLSSAKREKMRQVVLYKNWGENELINLLSKDVSSLSSVQPFIYEVYQEHNKLLSESTTTTDGPQVPSFVEFLMNHKNVCKKPSKQMVSIPFHSAEKGNITAQRCQKVNEHKQCVDNHSSVPCEGIDDKKVFVEYWLY